MFFKSCPGSHWSLGDLWLYLKVWECPRDLFFTFICNRSWAVCISPCAMGFGWTPLFNQKGQFFPLPYSWCSAFGPNAHTITNKLKPACIQTGWGLQETQGVILNTWCTNHSCQDEGDPKRRVPWCSLPKLRVDVTPRSKSDPRPLPHCVSGKRSPRQ